MTRKESAGVIKFEKACVLRQDTPQCHRDCKKCDLLLPTEDVLTAYDMAIKALEQEPYEDCISRQTAIEVAKQYWYKPDIAKALEELPSAQPEHKNAWISVHDAMPEERESIFAKYKGTAKWQKSFWEKQSDIVLVAIACKDGYKFVTTARTVDAVWKCDHLAIRGSEVTAWQPLPEPPEE